jgi:SAM-dependent methyltransferase
VTEPEFVTRTRESYDATADDFAVWIARELSTKPLDRAMLAGFAELVTGRVADIGCGAGRVTAHLDGLGVSAFGIDLSPGMVAAARRRYPGLRFDAGSMLSLDLADGELGGIVAWYSIIHVPDAELPSVFAEFHRVLAPGGYLLLAFQVGTGLLHLTEAGRHQVSLDFHRRRPASVADLLRGAGFVMRAQMEREQDEGGEFPERTPQAFLLARKPEASEV